ncbi:MAG TPA: ABC transporter permease [Clostridiaceae bacterium]|nr:ABC transporter permease [Clostridiaceae bacterium]
MMLSDRLFFAAMIIIPLLITVVTGYALRNEKADSIKIAVVDEDNSDFSKILVERLSVKEGIDLKNIDGEYALDLLKNNEVEEVFIIKRGFKDRIINGENEELIDVLKSPSSFSAEFAGELVAGEVMRLLSGSMAVNWVTGEYKRLGIEVDDNLEDEILKCVESQWEPEPLMTIRYQEMVGSEAKDTERVSMPASTAASVGVIIVFIMFYVLFCSGWLIEERISGTLKRLVSGFNTLGYSFIGSVLALMILGILQIILFFTVCKVVFDVVVFTSAWSYVVIFAYLLSVISISLFLSSILKTPSQLQAGAPVLALLMGFVGGCFWNFVEMPKSLKALSLLTPQGWTLEGINSLLVNPLEPASAIQAVMVLFAVSLILLPLSYIIIKRYVVT